MSLLHSNLAEDSLGGWSEVKVKRRKTKWRHSLAQFDSGFKLAKVKSIGSISSSDRKEKVDVHSMW